MDMFDYLVRVFRGKNANVSAKQIQTVVERFIETIDTGSQDQGGEGGAFISSDIHK